MGAKPKELNEAEGEPTRGKGYNSEVVRAQTASSPVRIGRIAAETAFQRVLHDLRAPGKHHEAH